MVESTDAFIEKLLHRHAQQPRHVLLPVSLTALAMAGICATAVPLLWVMAWLLLVAIVLTIRWFVVGSLDRANGRSAQARLRLAATVRMGKQLIQR